MYSSGTKGTNAYPGRLLSNKRPITLLNMIYKIGAKVFQMRLAPILQVFISQQQFAFLPGRNIHHSILLLNEILHQAESDGGQYALLKLDIVKAFDKLEWPFLLKILDKFGGLLTNFILASFASATSSIMINGIRAWPFKLARSVRQGCPLSPLLFIIAMDALSECINQDVATNLIQGVIIPETNLHQVQTFFTDDADLIVKADLSIILHCQHLFDSFGKVSGLSCDWSKTKVALIPCIPTPPPLESLDWQWETVETASKMLGFFVAQRHSEVLMMKELETRLDRRISRCSSRATSLMARIAVANHLITSTLWFTLTVWAGKASFLETLQKKMVRFICAGTNATSRHRVDAETLTRPRRQGGLGLISIPAQARALAGSIVLWAIQEGDQPLKQLLQFRIRALSADRWNTFNYAWIVNHCNTTPNNGSAVWTNICQAWNSLKRIISPRLPDNQEGWDKIPLWQPHVIHRSATLPHISGLSLSKFADAGLHEMQDMFHPDGSIKSWHGEVEGILPGYCRSLFVKLATNLHPICLLNLDRHKTKSLFLEYSLPVLRCVACEYCLPRREHSCHWRPAAHHTPHKSFHILNGVLVPTQLRGPVSPTSINRIFT